MIPGSNLLNAALTVIAASVVQYFAFTGRTINSIGMEVATYADPVPLRGSFQPMPKNLYQQYGLDLTKDYARFFTPKGVIAVDRGTSGDQVSFNSDRYQCESETDWFAVDGWTEVFLVKLKSA